MYQIGNYLTHDQLYQEHWIFAYEALKKGSLTSRTNYLSSDPFFSILSNSNVEFYDSTLQVKSANPTEVNNNTSSKTSSNNQSTSAPDSISFGGGGY